MTKNAKVIERLADAAGGMTQLGNLCGLHRSALHQARRRDSISTVTQGKLLKAAASLKVRLNAKDMTCGI